MKLTTFFCAYWLIASTHYMYVNICVRLSIHKGICVVLVAHIVNAQPSRQRNQVRYLLLPFFSMHLRMVPINKKC